MNYSRPYQFPTNVSELLGGEKFVSCSVVLPALCLLSRVMEVTEDDPAYMIKHTWRVVKRRLTSHGRELQQHLTQGQIVMLHSFSYSSSFSELFFSQCVCYVACFFTLYFLKLPL